MKRAPVLLEFAAQLRDAARGQAEPSRHAHRSFAGAQAGGDAAPFRRQTVQPSFEIDPAGGQLGGRTGAVLDQNLFPAVNGG
jgi:hypothetical protein